MFLDCFCRFALFFYTDPHPTRPPVPARNLRFPSVPSPGSPRGGEVAGSLDGGSGGWREAASLSLAMRLPHDAAFPSRQRHLHDVASPSTPPADRRSPLMPPRRLDSPRVRHPTPRRLPSPPRIPHALGICTIAATLGSRLLPPRRRRLICGRIEPSKGPFLLRTNPCPPSALLVSEW